MSDDHAQLADDSNEPAEPQAPEGEAKEAPKVQQILSDNLEDLTFQFAHGARVETRLGDYPEAVRNFFAYFGLRSKLRNFMVPGQDTKLTSEEMEKRLRDGIEMLKAGIMRAVRSDAGTGQQTLLVEAAMFYKRRKAAIKGEEWDGSAAEVARELEALTDEQIEQLKGTTLFQLAMQDAKDARAAKKRQELEEKVKKELENTPF